MSVFKTQGYLTLILDTGIDITSATTTNIKYKDPTGATGTFTGTLSGTTKILYQLTNSSIITPGTWEFQTYVVIGGLDAFGEVTMITFDNIL